MRSDSRQQGALPMQKIDVKKLAEQLDAAQSILDEIRVTSGCEAFGPPHNAPNQRTEKALRAAERAYQERRSRSSYVGSAELFGEPAWDVLLDLFIQQAKNETLSVKTACIDIDAPTSTAVRWLRVLEQHGLIAFDSDPAAEDQSLIHLTPTGYEGMRRYLESIAQ
jgi:DNA-binding MarR family transcriptional regulator